ncbi:MAG TPA: TIGR02530 family flagellar biosynthesis protein [Clostridium sp.]
MGYRIINGRAYQVGNIGDIQSTSSANKKIDSDGSFKDLLNKAIDKKQGYTLSKHAAERLKEMNFSEKDMKNIEKGFKLAEDKGAKNSVMVYKDVAIIASIENKTIITAVDKSRAQSNVFTNVDSVVIL